MTEQKKPDYPKNEKTDEPCDGCKFYSIKNVGNFPINPCTECSRFYFDKYQQVKKCTE